MILMSKINHLGNATLNSQGQLLIFVCLAQDILQPIAQCLVCLLPPFFSHQLLAPASLPCEKLPEKKNCKDFPVFPSLPSFLDMVSF